MNDALVCSQYTVRFKTGTQNKCRNVQTWPFPYCYLFLNFAYKSLKGDSLKCLNLRSSRYRNEWYVPYCFMYGCTC